MGHRHRCRVLARAALICSVTAAAVGPARADVIETDTWVEIAAPNPSPRSGAVIAYDTARARAVLFGGAGVEGALADTWEWNGSRWNRVPTAVAPAERAFALMTYDSIRARTLLFGGETERVVGGAVETLWHDDTWVWDGVEWLIQAPPTRPPARARAAFAFDPSSGHALLFGGVGASGVLGDTWEWDGATWRDVTPPSGPLPSGTCAMAFDPGMGRVVLTGRIGEIWSWSGVGWELEGPAPLSSASAIALAFDAINGRIVAATDNETFTWDGATWTRTSHVDATIGQGFSMTYASSPGEVLLFAGRNAGGRLLATTLAWDGAAWRDVTAEWPEARVGGALAYDARRERVVLFGGTSVSHAGNNVMARDTWLFDGERWAEVSGAVTPTIGSGRMTFDSRRGRVVLYGAGRLWEWDGTDWTERTASPVPTVWGTLAYDSRRDRTVLYGEGETWEWDGTAWTNVVPPWSPSAAATASSAYDVVGGRTLLYDSMRLWAWDGASWASIPSGVGWPRTTGAAAFAYDVLFERTTLFGGGAISNETWDLAATSWTRATPSELPSPVTGHGMAFDANRGRMVVFGGYGPLYIPTSETWERVVSRTTGSECNDDRQCESGWCIDAHCCSSDCARSTTDCVACSIAAGGELDGFCTPLTSTTASSTACRAAIDVCDLAETCVAGSSTCPADSVRTSGAVCRPAAGECDVVETCDGSSVACPRDTVRALGAVCRVAACEGGTAVSGAACTGVASDCTERVTPCTPFTCRGESCLTDCASDADCAAGFHCVASTGLCERPRPDAGPIDAAVAADGGALSSSRGCACSVPGTLLRTRPMLFLVLAVPAFAAIRGGRPRRRAAREA